VPDAIPLIDLTAEPRTLAASVDNTLRTSRFLLVTGHGIDPTLPTKRRSQGFEFFHLEAAANARYVSAIASPVAAHGHRGQRLNRR
jgi:isopenicillin N synthase-like dioxygenase